MMESNKKQIEKILANRIEYFKKINHGYEANLLAECLEGVRSKPKEVDLDELRKEFIKEFKTRFSILNYEVDEFINFFLPRLQNPSMSQDLFNKLIGWVSDDFVKGLFIHEYNLQNQVVALEDLIKIKKQESKDRSSEYKEGLEVGIDIGYRYLQKPVESDAIYTLDDMKKACAVGIDIVNKEGENNFKPFEDLINKLKK